MKRTYKTAIFEIHNPSKTKERMMLDALRRNHLAYTKGLTFLLGQLESIREELKQLSSPKQKESKIANLVNPVIKPLPLSNGCKAGVMSDLAGQIMAHHELLNLYETAQEKENQKEEDKRKPLSPPGAPSASRLIPQQDMLEEALQSLRTSTNLEQEDSARHDLMREARAGKLRPILFVKNRVSDGYLILKKPEGEQGQKSYLAFLNLHPKTSRFAKKHPVSLKGLINTRIGKDGTAELIKPMTTITGCLVHLNFGKDHQMAEFIEKGNPQSAKLLYWDGRFELHVSYEFSAEAVEPKCWLGIDRGIYNLASLCVVDALGQIIHSENFDGRALRFVQMKEERRQRKVQKSGRHYKSATRRSEANKAVHMAANRIVSVALDYQAQPVMERLGNLTSHTGKRKRSNFNRVFNRSQYTKLASILAYKLAAAGLPKAKEVVASYTSQTCPECGHWEPENRPKAPLPDGSGFAIDRFICQRCNYQCDADLNAARVIALKKIWRDQLSQAQRSKLFSELKDTKYSFAGFLKQLAEKRR
jgi:putative transposase